MMADERTFEMEIELNATPEQVWAAISDGEGLQRWFPPIARVEPGVGGTIFMDWGNGMAGTSEIEAWVPNEHLRGVWVMPMGDDAPPIRLGVDWYLSSKGGTTVLRLVHSGFTTDSAWDEQYDSISGGWGFELRGLRHYLEHHNGTDRRVVTVRHPVTDDDAATWASAIGKEGLDLRLDGASEGDGFTIRLGDRDVRGTIAVNKPLHFAGAVDGCANAFLRVALDRGCDAGEGGPVLTLWLSTYGAPEEEIALVEQAWEAMSGAIPSA